MNERLKELWSQAGGHYNGGNQHTWPEYTITDPEKFAALIVRECMTMCDETRVDYFKHRKAADDFTDKNIYAEGEAASDIIKYKMKKHFGVEE